MAILRAMSFNTKSPGTIPDLPIVWNIILSVPDHFLFACTYHIIHSVL